MDWLIYYSTDSYMCMSYAFFASLCSFLSLLTIVAASYDALLSIIRQQKRTSYSHVVIVVLHMLAF